MNIKKYAATVVMAARTHDYFGLANMLGNYLLRLVRLAAMIFIWRGLFAQGADTGGMTLAQVLTYTYMSSVLEPMLDVRTPASSWLHEGGIVSNFMRPLGLLTQLTLHTVGTWVQPMLLFALPALIIAPMIGISIAPATPWAFVSIALTISQGFAVDCLFACLLIRMKNMSWTIHSLRGALTALFTGSVIPFALLPWNLGKYLEYTPFGTLAGAALAVYSGTGDTFMIIFMQILWNAVLWPLALICFRRSRERMISYGG